MTLKRRSTGCIRQPSYYASTSNQSTIVTKEVWRPPGFYEIPNVFGSDCFLKPEPYDDHKNAFNLRSYPSTNKYVEKRPWYPVGPANEIPQLPPLVRRSENEFERSIRKGLSHQKKISISSLDPRNKYANFKEIGTG